jgi:O-antigen ligase
VNFLEQLALESTPSVRPSIIRRTGNRTSRGLLDWRPDAVSILSITVVLAFFIPARYVVHGIGAVGTPANLVGVGLMVLWLLNNMASAPRPRGCRPVRIVVTIYLMAILITYAGGFARGMFQDETNNATRFAIETFALSGIALVAAEGIANRARLEVLLQRIVYGTAFMGFTGILEATTPYDLAKYLHFPGLVLNGSLIANGSRGAEDFARVAGTASHYIEYGVVLGMCLPLAIHLAIFSKTRGRRQANWLLTAIISFGVPFAVSRAAAVAVVIAVLVLASCWTWRARFDALVIAAVGAVAMKFAKPGLLGTIRSLFLNANSDPSISGRTTDYASSFFYIGQRPIFGRGAGSYLPERYRVLDNQMLLTTIESGVVGLTAFVLLFIAGVALAHRVAKMSPDPETRHLGYAILAAFPVGFITSFFFDSLSFNIFSIVFFLYLGIAGALWRLGQPDRAAAQRGRAAMAQAATNDHNTLVMSRSSEAR